MARETAAKAAEKELRKAGITRQQLGIFDFWVLKRRIEMRFYQDELNRLLCLENHNTVDLLDYQTL